MKTCRLVSFVCCFFATSFCYKSEQNCRKKIRFMKYMMDKVYEDNVDEFDGKYVSKLSVKIKRGNVSGR